MATRRLPSNDVPVRRQEAHSGVHRRRRHTQPVSDRRHISQTLTQQRQHTVRRPHRLRAPREHVSGRERPAGRQLHRLRQAHPPEIAIHPRRMKSDMLGDRTHAQHPVLDRPADRQLRPQPLRHRRTIMQTAQRYRPRVALRLPTIPTPATVACRRLSTASGSPLTLLRMTVHVCPMVGIPRVRTRTAPAAKVVVPVGGAMSGIVRTQHEETSQRREGPVPARTPATRDGHPLVNRHRNSPVKRGIVDKPPTR